LISSLAVYAKVNNLGFIETPYRKSIEGKVDVTKEPIYLSAEEEEGKKIAQSNLDLDASGKITLEKVVAREEGDFPLVAPEEVDYMDVSQSPIVGTGLERRVATDSRILINAEGDGVVQYVDSNHITIKYSRTKNQALVSFEEDSKTYNLIKFRKTNQGTSTWKGYNFEDAIVISEKVVREDIFTSIHIDEYSLDVRDTKLGAEELTADIPNVSEEATKDLDENGMIRIGAEVKPGDILIGKITPKGYYVLSLVIMQVMLKMLH